MYQRRRKNPLPILVLIGIVVGIVFVLLDQPPTPPTTEPLTTPRISPTGGALNTPTPPPTNISTPPSTAQSARLLIPAAAVSSPIIPVYLDGTSWDVSKLGVNVGHLQGTAWFNNSGNVVLSGHVELSDGRRGVFASIKDLLVGDTIIIEYEGVERRYTVTEITTAAPDDLTPLYPSQNERLTLITCDSYDFLSDSYLNRTVVIAERQG